jgi:DNA-binding NarL/FixJ family response regulator
LKREINKDAVLRSKSIPFIFLSTSASKKEVSAAYELMVQGYFKKPGTFDDIKALLEMILNYWDYCAAPEEN